MLRWADQDSSQASMPRAIAWSLSGCAAYHVHQVLLVPAYHKRLFHGCCDCANTRTLEQVFDILVISVHCGSEHCKLQEASLPKKQQLTFAIRVKTESYQDGAKPSACVREPTRSIGKQEWEMITKQIQQKKNASGRSPLIGFQGCLASSAWAQTRAACCSASPLVQMVTTFHRPS